MLKVENWLVVKDKMKKNGKEFLCRTHEKLKDVIKTERMLKPEITKFIDRKCIFENNAKF
jgi:hypothetical protein